MLRFNRYQGDHMQLSNDFLLDPGIHFLNHGSFGACPRPVFDVYQRWQRELEAQPVEFLGRRVGDLLQESRAALAAYLGTARDDVVYFTNPTTAMNMVARNLFRDRPGWRGLGAGDEIVSTDHEYGALVRTWRYLAAQSGARYVEVPIPVPVSTHADFVERFWARVTPRTRVVYLSHITSPSALTFPVSEICRRAREAGILAIVDGAHAPAQIPLDLQSIGADIYTGACHKWLMAPKGAAFLYARPEVQPLLEPLVVSWGWESERPGPSRFVDWHEWQGTRDVSAFLAVPAAIAYQAAHDWPAVRERCHALAVETRARIEALTGLPPVSPEDASEGERWFHQVFTAQLPAGVDLSVLKERLYAEHRVEVPLTELGDASYIRVSIQVYNDRDDTDALLAGLAALL